MGLFSIRQSTPLASIVAFKLANRSDYIGHAASPIDLITMSIILKVWLPEGEFCEQSILRAITSKPIRQSSDIAMLPDHNGHIADNFDGVMPRTITVIITVTCSC